MSRRRSRKETADFYTVNLKKRASDSSTHIKKLTNFKDLEDENPPESPAVKIKQIIISRLPILTWLPTYTLSLFLQDLLAGFTVGLTEIPQGIAYATVAGLPTQYGLYSGIMGGSMYFLFGTCKDINMGPTALMALFIQNCVTTMGPDGAALICFISGVLIFSAGVLRLGFIVDFFSYPIISGFTIAAAVSIACSQLKPLLGISGGSSSEFLQTWISLFKHIGETRKWDAIVGFTTVVVLFMFREIKKYGSLKEKPEWPRNRNVLAKFIFYLSLGGNALMVVTGTTIAYVADKYYNATPLLLTGSVQSGLPNMDIPPFSTTWNGTHFGLRDMLSEYGTLIVFCPMIAFLEHIAIVKAFKKGKFVDATQEMLALGIGNMAGSLVHSMPVTGSFTRTAVNNASGVRTTAGGLVTASMLLVSLAFLTGIFKYIPRATLASVIMVSMYYLCDFEAIMVMWRTKKLDLIPFFATVICSLLLSLEYGIIIGISTSILFLLYDVARPQLLIEMTWVQDHTVYLVQPKVGLYFPAAEYLREEILRNCALEKSTVVINGEFIRNVDATVARSCGTLFEELRLRNQELIFWNFNESVTSTFTGDNKVLISQFRSGNLDNIIKGSTIRKPSMQSP